MKKYIVASLLLMVLAVPTYAAFSSETFLKAAKKYYNRKCDDGDEDGKKGTLCYLFLKVGELDEAQEQLAQRLNALEATPAPSPSPSLSPSFVPSPIPSAASNFPAPDFDSGWIAFEGKTSVIDVPHNLGGNVDNYFVEATYRRPSGSIMSHQTAADKVWWEDVEPNNIQIVRNGDVSNLFDAARVRIWVHEPGPETIVVSSLTGTPVESHTVLEEGKQYIIEASGTYTYAPGGRIADAEFAYSPDDDDWLEGVTSPEYVLDLFVNDTPQDWLGSADGQTYTPHTYSPDHVYRLEVVGSGNPLAFKIHDSSYDWNEGGLTVSIAPAQ